MQNAPFPLNKDGGLISAPVPGLGDRVQSVIHAGLDALPMPVKARNAIKQCGGCAKRKAALNKAGEALKSIVSG